MTSLVEREWNRIRHCMRSVLIKFYDARDIGSCFLKYLNPTSWTMYGTVCGYSTQNDKLPQSHNVFFLLYNYWFQQSSPFNHSSVVSPKYLKLSMNKFRSEWILKTIIIHKRVEKNKSTRNFPEILIGSDSISCKLGTPYCGIHGFCPPTNKSFIAFMGLKVNKKWY